MTPGPDSAARSVRPFGLPFGTAMTSWFFTKMAGVPVASPASVTVFMVAGLAAANTSAGAPEVIWVARPELPPNEKVTFGARVRRLEVLADPRERLGQRGGRQHGDAAALSSRRRAGGVSLPHAAIAATSASVARHPHPHPSSPRSTTTVVDLITAVAGDPTSRPSSSTASRLISDTSRNGPAWMST